jgi:hypothetical protein
MPAKVSPRKRPLEESPGRALRTKRRKDYSDHHPLSQYPDINPPEQGKFWAASDIIDERRVNGRKEYLVVWVGIDPTTNQPYEPDWVPARDSNKQLLEAYQWKKEQGFVPPSLAATTGSPIPNRKDLSSGLSCASSSPNKSGRITRAAKQAVEDSPSPLLRHQRRAKPVIDSSQESPTAHQALRKAIFDRALADSSEDQHSSHSTVPESQQSLAPDPEQPSPLVQVSQHSQSFYAAYDQASSQSWAAASETESASKALHVVVSSDGPQEKAGPATSQVIPDSQESQLGNSISTGQPASTGKEASAEKAPSGSVRSCPLCLPCARKARAVIGSVSEG